MLERPRTTLAGFGDRVEFRLGDMGALARPACPSGADVMRTSRASHHLDRPDCTPSTGRRPVCWRPAAGWSTSTTSARARCGTAVPRGAQGVRAAARRPAAHHHDGPLPSVEDHLDGYRAAGVTEADVAWKAFYTCLFMGRAAQG